MTHLTINQVCELTALYRKGVTVPELAKKFNADYETVIKLGRGGRATVYDFDGNVLCFDKDRVDPETLELIEQGILS